MDKLQRAEELLRPLAHLALQRADAVVLAVAVVADAAVPAVVVGEVVLRRFLPSNKPPWTKSPRT